MKDYTLSPLEKPQAGGGALDEALIVALAALLVAEHRRRGDPSPIEDVPDFKALCDERLAELERRS